MQQEIVIWADDGIFGEPRCMQPLQVIEGSLLEPLATAADHNRYHLHLKYLLDKVIVCVTEMLTK